MIEPTKQPIEPTPTSEVPQPTKHSVTLRCECGLLFVAKSINNRFCSGPCRQRAYRRSPAHRSNLDGLKTQRLNRRNFREDRLNRDKYLGFDAHLSGPSVAGVPALGDIQLGRFSKDSIHREPLRPAIIKTDDSDDIVVQ